MNSMFWMMKNIGCNIRVNWDMQLWELKKGLAPCFLATLSVCWSTSSPLLTFSNPSLDIPFVLSAMKEAKDRLIHPDHTQHGDRAGYPFSWSRRPVPPAAATTVCSWSLVEARHEATGGPHFSHGTSGGGASCPPHRRPSRVTEASP
jgi:hypothetical protein